MDYHTGYIVTLANSIIGVSILAMPYCFKQTGILLSLIMLLLSNLITRLTCHFLIKSAIMSRRKTFEYLAYHIFGSLGKFAIDVGMIGFLIGTCIAFFVVMGDLGPEFISELTGRDMDNTMRTVILVALAVLCILPLGLLRNVDSLHGVSKATIGFYFCFVLKISIEAMPHIFTGDWINKVEFWRPAGIIQCLPIFSMALSCQSQLFEIYQAVHNPTLDQMNHVVKNAINICTAVYFCVGLFGYIAFAHKSFTGNILMSFEPSTLTNVLKLGFVLSVAFSFPLVVFPCRASVHSLIYRDVHSLHESTSNYIPEGRFKGITIAIICISLLVGIMIPNIELVLGLIGSTIGIAVCVLFPVLCFIYISTKNTNERLLAKFIFAIGFILMILGTFENFNRLDKIESFSTTVNPITEKKDVLKIIENPISNLKKDDMDLINKPLKSAEGAVNEKINQSKIETIKIITERSLDIRHEPPEPIEPQEPEKVAEQEEIKPIPEVVKVEEIIKLGPVEIESNIKNQSKNDEVDIEAIKKDETEMKLQVEEQKQEDSHLEEHKIILDTIQKQNEVQEEIVKQQKKLIEVIQEQNQQKVNEEKMKAVKEIESIALKAIEKISSDVKENEKIVAKLEKDVKEKVNSEERPPENKEINVNALKIENILLKNQVKVNSESINSSKAKNILPHKIEEIPKPVKNVEQKINTTNANNNTAPLFINLGQNSKGDEDKPSINNIPLPIINSVKLSTKTLNKTNDKTDNKIKKDILLDDDTNVMRRDILAYISTKRKR
ncbi:putative sodium-coupled neutral amino acid transporter 10 [Sitophilus oryzae]|uniref:Sodium-coupled neutral amino acid transporter 10 n=1 Tax=Sitophilus oryzae TaxID=7048 RepID=A0A6J2Y4K2_SITOR|nr:putative sodium-coupled neutral amino acid transporter 10 [Sitophilus oryzae]